MTSEKLVALQVEFDQLQADRKALKKGDAGYPLSDDVLLALDIRIATVRDAIAQLTPLASAKKARRRT
ncbi:MAG: hypothetical protein ABI740_00085 [Alphaproteobacteria bacterium]